MVSEVAAQPNVLAFARKLNGEILLVEGFVDVEGQEFAIIKDVYNLDANLVLLEDLIPLEGWTFESGGWLQ